MTIQFSSLFGAGVNRILKLNNALFKNFLVAILQGKAVKQLMDLVSVRVLSRLEAKLTIDAPLIDELG